MREGLWTRRGGLTLGLSVAAGLPWAGRARAQGGRLNTRIVVPYPPAGTTDVTARLITASASAALGQVWVIENRSGANGAVGAQEVARAAPDGQTLLYSNEVHLVLKFVQRGVPFDAVTDFTPVLRTVSIPYVLVGSAQHVAQKDVGALIDAAKRDPARFTFAGSTLGSVGQLGAAALGQKLGRDLTIVAYRGSGPAVNDLLAGSVALMFAPLGAVLPLIQGGQLRAFAVTTPNRVSVLPDVPTMVEGGYPEMLFDGWTAIWGPRGLPAARAEDVRRAVSATLREPAIVQRLAELGCTPIQESTADFSRLMAVEQARNGAIIRAAGIEPE